jgi:hypothetical protein
MGSGHGAQYEKSFYIDSTQACLPYPPLPGPLLKGLNVKYRTVYSSENSDEITRQKIRAPVKKQRDLGSGLD